MRCNAREIIALAKLRKPDNLNKMAKFTVVKNVPKNARMINAIARIVVAQQIKLGSKV